MAEALPQDDALAARIAGLSFPSEAGRRRPGSMRWRG